ncbi:MAG: hypothetical protein JXA06_11585 [Bacteroidetes bacterium]|nr:hypothetical protein [Bacteroidota bacterium]
MDEAIQRDILNELRIIKKLLAQNLISGQSQIRQIEKLASIGFQPKEIAEILGTTTNTVSVSLNRVKKKRIRR